jgi:GxxExxY protein
MVIKTKESPDEIKEFLYKDLTYKILGCCFEVYNELGYGFLEKVYQKALFEELRLKSIKAKMEKPITVYYKEINVGDYKADILVEDKIILELKAEKTYNKIHEAQLINYLKATSIKVGYLINFGQKKVAFERFAN